MDEHLYLCHDCGHIFRPMPGDAKAPGQAPSCPECGNPLTRELPSWVPAGTDLYNAPAAWDYECQSCRERFQLPVPRRPSDEAHITCPACHGAHIHRLTPAGYEPLYCG